MKLMPVLHFENYARNLSKFHDCKNTNAGNWYTCSLYLPLILLPFFLSLPYAACNPRMLPPTKYNDLNRLTALYDLTANRLLSHLPINLRPA